MIANFVAPILSFLLGAYLVYHDHKKAMRDLVEFHLEEKRKLQARIPVVQHCNERTRYEFITHKYDPERCEHCGDIRGILEG